MRSRGQEQSRQTLDNYNQSRILMFLNDQETATDLLHYEAIARTVVRFINETPRAPVTIGVHGDWGAGKSSVLKMTEAAFHDRKLSS